MRKLVLFYMALICALPGYAAGSAGDYFAGMFSRFLDGAVFGGMVFFLFCGVFIFIFAGLPSMALVCIARLIMGLRKPDLRQRYKWTLVCIALSILPILGLYGLNIMERIMTFVVLANIAGCIVLFPQIPLLKRTLACMTMVAALMVWVDSFYFNMAMLSLSPIAIGAEIIRRKRLARMLTVTD